VCGAVSGGILALGAKFGRGQQQGDSAKEETYSKTRELIDRFTAERGTVVCRELLGGCDLLTEEGQGKFKTSGLRDRTCIPCVVSAVRIVERLLDSDGRVIP
jgi:C_GCAxxG_C_C family probable redox protein